MEHLNDLDLADDVVLASQRCSGMQSKLNDLVERSSAAGLNINVSKTKSLDVNAANPSNFTVAGQVMDKVESYQYLGSQIASDGGTKSDIGARIKKASETWGISAESTLKLQVFINRCLRYIIRTWWPDNWISNAELHRRCHQKPILTEIRERKWRSVGHSLRKSGKEICKQTLDWNPAGHRSRGRPRGSWRRSRNKKFKRVEQNLTWAQVKVKANNRPGWKSFSLALYTTAGAQDT
ncbi:uncharacterized protein LOC131434127 [Malaya genurostris]|uniref:uncharacterized protein LOC131434127 n=1 Tax=Malaya genurostris TaxID=325434 RepID=UPI0026F3CEE0|nr:uncharacterized protein LOC131434127 [Malaya genurostris]